MQEKLWEPFGFSRAQWGLDSHGHATGHFALALTLQDFAHLGQLYLENLMLNGEPTVSDDWFDMVAMAHTPSHEPSVDAEGKRGRHACIREFRVRRKYGYGSRMKRRIGSVGGAMNSAMTKNGCVV